MVSELVAWLTNECGGGCSVSYAAQRFGQSLLDAAVSQGLCEYRGQDGNEDIAVV